MPSACVKSEHDRELAVHFCKLADQSDTGKSHTLSAVDPFGRCYRSQLEQLHAKEQPSQRRNELLSVVNNELLFLSDHFASSPHNCTPERGRAMNNSIVEHSICHSHDSGSQPQSQQSLPPVGPSMYGLYLWVHLQHPVDCFSQQRHVVMPAKRMFEFTLKSRMTKFGSVANEHFLSV